MGASPERSGHLQGPRAVGPVAWSCPRLSCPWWGVPRPCPGRPLSVYLLRGAGRRELPTVLRPRFPLAPLGELGALSLATHENGVPLQIVPTPHRIGAPWISFFLWRVGRPGVQSGSWGLRAQSWKCVPRPGSQWAGCVINPPLQCPAGAHRVRLAPFLPGSSRRGSPRRCRGSRALGAQGACGDKQPSQRLRHDLEAAFGL